MLCGTNLSDKCKKTCAEREVLQMYALCGQGCFTSRSGNHLWLCVRGTWKRIVAENYSAHVQDLLFHFHDFFVATVSLTSILVRMRRRQVEMCSLQSVLPALGFPQLSPFVPAFL